MSANLLNRIFPAHVAEMLVRNERVPPEEFANVTILFSDVVGFTVIASECTPLETHSMLNDLYIIQDYCLKFFPRLYKVETIGDAFMVIGGAPLHRSNSVGDMLQFSLLINHMVKRVCFHPKTRAPIRLRIGMHTGDVVGGVVGFLMPRYTFAGDAVNFAARMQQICSEDCITMSQDATMAVASMFSSECPECKDTLATCLDGIDKGVTFNFKNFTIESLGNVAVKGKGDRQTFALRGSGAWNTMMSKSDATFDKDLRRLHRISSEEKLLGGPSSLLGFSTRPPSPCAASISNSPHLIVADGQLVFPKSIGKHVRIPSWSLLCSSTVEKEDVEAVLNSLAMKSILSMEELPVELADASTNYLDNDPDDYDNFYDAEQGDTVDYFAKEDGLIASALSSMCVAEKESPEITKETVARINLLNGLRVVVVEDSAVQKKLICRQVSNMNKTWQVKSSTCLDDVRKMFTESPSPFDMILIDMNLGTSSADGPSLLCSLRAEFPQAMEKIVSVATSKDSNDRLLQACFVTFDAFWAKPLAVSSILYSHIQHIMALKINNLRNSVHSLEISVDCVDGVVAKMSCLTQSIYGKNAAIDMVTESLDQAKIVDLTPWAVVKRNENMTLLPKPVRG